MLLIILVLLASQQLCYSQVSQKLGNDCKVVSRVRENHKLLTAETKVSQHLHYVFNC
jgi:hypothetical protein